MPSMNLLAIESSTENCSVALEAGGQRLERQAVEPRGHAQRILPWSQALLAEAGLGFNDLDGLVVGRGPGSFTSLRIGLGIAQGVALAHDLPIYPVSSLEALAQTVDPDCQAPALLCLLDARMGEVYAGWYRCRDGKRLRVGDEALLPPASLSLPDGEDWVVTGPGARAYKEITGKALGTKARFADEEHWPGAPALLSLAQQVEPIDAYSLEPTYLRDQVTG